MPDRPRLAEPLKREVSRDRLQKKPEEPEGDDVVPGPILRASPEARVLVVSSEPREEDRGRDTYAPCAASGAVPRVLFDESVPGVGVRVVRIRTLFAHA